MEDGTRGAGQELCVVQSKMVMWTGLWHLKSDVKSREIVSDAGLAILTC